MKFPELYLICRAFNGGYDQLLDMLLQDYRIEEKNHYGTILRDNFPRGIPSLYSELNKEYLSRRYQNRHSINHPTKIPFNGLQRKINQELKREIKQRKAENEKGIRDAFREDSLRNKEYKRNLKGVTKETRRQLRKSRYRK